MSGGGIIRTFFSAALCTVVLVVNMTAAPVEDTGPQEGSNTTVKEGKKRNKEIQQGIEELEKAHEVLTRVDTDFDLEKATKARKQYEKALKLFDNALKHFKKAELGVEKKQAIEEIIKGYRDLQKSDADLNQGKFDVGLDHYQSAMDHFMKAYKILTS